MISGARYDRAATYSVMKPWWEPHLALAHPPGEHPRARQVADFELAVDVDQEAARFEATMNKVGGPNVLETKNGLTNKTENEGRRADLGGDHSEIGGCRETKRPYDGVQIGLHQLLLKC